MAKSMFVIGLIGPMVLGSMSVAAAQEAAPPPETHAEQAPAAPVAPPPSCSGLGCLFSGGAAASQQVAQQPSPEPAPAETAEAEKPKAKPQHPITIAADPAEAERLKGLVAALPKGKVKIVRAAGGDATAGADFSVAPSLDEHEAGEKAKLFTEQMHVLAGSDIHAIADLRDKVVSFGPDKSESQAAARKAFAALGVAVKETPLEIDNALDGLATGDVAAVVVLAPQPVQRFERLEAPGLHLVAWPQDGALPAGAVPATIDSARYPGLAKAEGEVRAVGIDAILKISPKGARLPAAKSFLATLAQHSASLSRHGFDLIKADLETRTGRRFASDEQR